jgi:hypothetical protein
VHAFDFVRKLGICRDGIYSLSIGRGGVEVLSGAAIDHLAGESEPGEMFQSVTVVSTISTSLQAWVMGRVTK